MDAFSVGHSKLTAAELIALLRAHGVGRVADVRRFPVSKRHPQHARPALEAALREAGIEYAFLGRELGGRLEPELPIERSENRALREPAFRAYADALASPAFESGFARLEELARERPLAFLCAERDWRQCHRRILSDALVARGWRVLHLVPARSPEAHALDPRARIDGERLRYPSLL
ncbi:MAG: DUF488 domain-containing protein [Myxococcota bacterium]